MSDRRFGLSVALTTPFRESGTIDFKRLAAHARACLEGGCDSVTLFGTTGEGSSVGMAEREQVLGAASAAGIEGGRLVGGIMASAVDDAAEQARMALDFDCRALLVPPPFYFKGISEEGQFAWFAAFFERLGARARNVILYNIPSVTQVAVPVELVGRLRTAFPEVVMGVKDSSGDWDYTSKLLAAHKDLAILVGDERHLAAAVRLGGQGAISGLANICPDVIGVLANEGREDARIKPLVDALLTYPVTPAVKALVAHKTGDPAWLAARVPLKALTSAQVTALTQLYDRTFAAQAA